MSWKETCMRDKYNYETLKYDKVHLSITDVSDRLITESGHLANWVNGLYMFLWFTLIVSVFEGLVVWWHKEDPIRSESSRAVVDK